MDSHDGSMKTDFDPFHGWEDRADLSWSDGDTTIFDSQREIFEDTFNPNDIGQDMSVRYEIYCDSVDEVSIWMDVPYTSEEETTMEHTTRSSVQNITYQPWSELERLAIQYSQTHQSKSNGSPDTQRSALSFILSMIYRISRFISRISSATLHGLGGGRISDRGRP